MCSPHLYPAGQHTIADDALDDTFTLQGVRARQPRRPAGGFDWRWNGPHGDPEWAWFFNRHGWFVHLWRAWVTTAEPAYRDALFSTLADWISANPPPGHFTFSASWRPLEAARRLLGSWLPLHAALLGEPHLKADLRDQFQKSLGDHGNHLRRHHALRGNHLVTEMLALVRLALALPGHACAADWLGYGLDRLDRAYRSQVYPDGSYNELASHYQRIVAQSYQQLVDALRAAHRDELAAKWARRVERLWIYMREITTPAGFNPLNNDSDREPYARLIREQATTFAETTSRGSAHFAWAGQTVFRDHTEHEWGFFDAGPAGTDHAHADRLSFTLSLGDRDFLVDNGRHTYAPGPWRDYFAGPDAHNILQLDGHASHQGPTRVHAAPRQLAFRDDRDYAVAWGDAFFTLAGNPRAADWRRIVIHIPGRGWMVLDHLATFGARHLTTQWHWDPGCVLPSALDLGAGFRVQHGGRFLRVRLLGTAGRGETESVIGRVFPSPQGWFSDRFNHRQESATLLHHQRISGPMINVWLFERDDAPGIEAVLLPGGHVRFSTGGPRPLVLSPRHPERLPSRPAPPPEILTPASPA